jgi:hypothetical protein
MDLGDIIILRVKYGLNKKCEMASHGQSLPIIQKKERSEIWNIEKEMEQLFSMMRTGKYAKQRLTKMEPKSQKINR